jgi:IS5 family transposase
VREGISTIVLRTICPDQTLWEAILPPEALSLPAGLAEIDALLDDPRFFEPFRPYFSAREGRPSIPMEWFLRLMFLRFRYKLGFEALCREVTDSLAWRRFCRIPLGVSVPHPSTLEKILSRTGQDAVDALNEALLAKGHENCLIKTDKVRTDTTVVAANVAYPTDSGLLAKGVARLSLLVRRVKDGGLAARTGFRDRTASVRRRAHDIAAFLRRRNDEAKEEVKAKTAEMATIAAASVAEAAEVVRNARRTLARRGVATASSAYKLLAEVESLAATIETVVAQTHTRLGGEVPDGATRVVSLHDTDARPIRKGRLGKLATEFGYKAQVSDNVDGVVVDHLLVKGNPPDAPMLAPAIARIKARFGAAPKAVTADRGYGEAGVEAEVSALGVKKVVIPRKGRPGAARLAMQRSRGFTKLVKWRTGSEARVACLKRDWGWSRTLIDGEAGAATWCGWGVLAHNSAKIAKLMADKQATGPPGAEASRAVTTV